jgi:hypothetical protein
VLPKVTSSDVSVNEADGVATFNFLLSTAPLAESSFVVRAVDGVAVAGIDFEPPAAGTKVTFPAGIKSQSLFVKIVNDHARKFNRDFRLQLEQPVGLDLGTASVSAVIVDDDFWPFVEFDKPAQVVGKAQGLASITVRLSVPAPERLDVQYTVGGTGVYGVDHQFGSASSATSVITFPTGTMQATITGAILNNQQADRNKTIILTLVGNDKAIVGNGGSQTIVISDSNSDLIATVAGQPSGLNNVKSLNVSVGGVGVTQYKYKIVNSYTCNSTDGYSSPRSAALAIRDDIAALADGLVYLCVIAGNASDVFQSVGSATSVSWTKSTLPPPSPQFNGIVSSNRALNPLQALSNLPTVQVLAGNVKAGNSVKLFDSQTCDNSSLIGTTVGAADTVTATGTYVQPRDHKLYAEAVDQFGQVSSCVLFLSLYRLDIAPPTVLDVSVTNPAGAYGLFSTITIKVKFSEPIEIRNFSNQIPTSQFPYLNLNTLPDIATATYSALDNDTLTFIYTPVAGQNTPLLDYFAQTSFVASANTIKDLAGNNALLTLAVPHSAQSISGKISVRIDTDVPEAVSALSDGTWWGSVLTSPNIVWASVQDVGGSGVKGYEVAIGTAQGLSDVVDWTFTTNTSIQFTGTFSQSQRYFASIRVKDNAGNLSAVTKGNGWEIDPDPPTAFDVTQSANFSYDQFTSPRIEWTASSDSKSGLLKYEIALGTNKGLADVVGWTTLSNSTLFYVFSYNGAYGVHYYPTVRAVDAGGNITTVEGDGWLNVKPVTNPNPALSFTTNQLATPDSIQFSNEVLVQGTQVDVWVSVTSSLDGRQPAFSINGGPYVNSAMIKAGDKLKLRAKAASKYGDQLTIGVDVGSGHSDWVINSWGCPQWYSLVKSFNPTVKDFCVAKYEPTITSVPNSPATARPNADTDPTPVGNLQTAVAVCRANGSNYDLISNAEFQLAAKDIEQVAWNWSGNAVGSGILSGGNINPSRAPGPRTAILDDNQACYGVSASGVCDLVTWNKYRRVHKLQSGDYVWDLSGNNLEWVSDTFSVSDFASYNASAEVCEDQESTSTGNPPVTSVQSICRVRISKLTTAFHKSQFGPLGDYSAISDPIDWGGIGSILEIPSTASDQNTWISRGGDFRSEILPSSTSTSPVWRGGIFSVFPQGTDPTQTKPAVARCVFRQP